MSEVAADWYELMIPRRIMRPRGLDVWHTDIPRPKKHTSTHGLPKDWRRRPGRPRHSWLRTLNADLHPLNHGERTQLSKATCKGQRTMEATRGNGYAPVWGSLGNDETITQGLHLVAPELQLIVPTHGWMARLS